MFALPVTPRESAVAFTAALFAATAFVAAVFIPTLIDGSLTRAYWGAAVAIAFVAGLTCILVPAAMRVDPWAMQKLIMSKSRQPTPDTAELNRFSLMYFALCAEELGETATPLADALARRINAEGRLARLSMASKPGDDPRNGITPGIRQAYDFLMQHGPMLGALAANLRGILKSVPVDFRFPLLPQEAIEVADGVTDLAVTTAGLAVACGMPGASLYEEVGGSNLSKANPETGLIDIDSSGKWIKGENFWLPDLAGVLAAEQRIFDDRPPLNF